MFFRRKVVDWRDGSANARYATLKMLIEAFQDSPSLSGSGSLSGSPVWKSVCQTEVVSLSPSSTSSSLYAKGFLLHEKEKFAKRILFVNRNAVDRVEAQVNVPDQSSHGSFPLCFSLTLSLCWLYRVFSCIASLCFPFLPLTLRLFSAKICTVSSESYQRSICRSVSDLKSTVSVILPPSAIATVSFF